MPGDPQELVDLAWRELSAAVSVVDHPWRMPVLVTGGSRSDGRVVVLRRFDPDIPELVCFSDQRATKIQAIRTDPRVAWVFYHSQLRIQVRVEATAAVVQGEAAATFWQNLPESSRREYAMAAAPGSVWQGQSALSETEAMRHFAMIHTRPDRWDILQLGRDGHLRVNWTAARGAERVVP